MINLNEFYESFEYKKYKIPKKNGLSRLICAPNEQTKIVQRFIVKQIEKHKKIHRAVFSYRKNLNTKLHAQMHFNQVCALTVDIKDFFHMFHFKWIEAYFKSIPELSKRAAYYASAATTKIIDPLTGLQRFDNPRMPQGSVCSPILSNVLFYKMDCLIERVAKHFNGQYTRYADDLTISFPYEISNFDVKRVIFRIRDILKTCGMELNNKKTRLQHSPNIWITGELVGKY